MEEELEDKNVVIRGRTPKKAYNNILKMQKE
jgi:hypothetical protein